MMELVPPYTYKRTLTAIYSGKTIDNFLRKS